jgi:hypothetical protein
MSVLHQDLFMYGIVFWGFSYHFYVYDLFRWGFSKEPLVSLRFIIVSILSVIVLIANSNKKIVRVIVFNATFNNISAISWWSVLLVAETGVPGVNHRNVANHWQTVSHNVVSSTPLPNRIRTHNLVLGRWWSYKRPECKLHGVPGKNHRRAASHWETSSHV